MNDDDLLSRRALLGGLGVGAAGLGVVAVADTLGGGDSADVDVDVRWSDRTVTLAETDQGPLTADLSGTPVVGAPGADVAIYYWTDFQCPFCERFERETFPELYRSHVEPGTVQFVVLQFPYLGDDSVTAALVDKCVWRQVRASNPDRYWDWHPSVFDEQAEKGSGWASRDSLLDIAAGVEGVDADAVGTCLDGDTEAVETSVEADRSLGRSLGVGGTPGFVLRNTDSGAMGRISGAQPYDRFTSAIEQIREA